MIYDGKFFEFIFVLIKCSFVENIEEEKKEETDSVVLLRRAETLYAFRQKQRLYIIEISHCTLQPRC
jgi:hypothetical protein